MSNDSYDLHFAQFSKALKEANKVKYGYDEREKDSVLLKRQQRQMNRLVRLEREFRIKLKKSPYGKPVYKAFVKKITDPKAEGGNGNVLTSRPYFRERQAVCTGPICHAIKEENITQLMMYHVNNNFIRFAVQTGKFRPNGQFMRLANEIEAIRNEIIELNMPLAISRARLFWSKVVSKDQSKILTYMDFVQLSSEGLMSAIDKYVLPFKRNFRATIIGWATGNFIEAYSQTSIHFYPKEKRKIYRGRKNLKFFQENVDYEQLADRVNIGAKPSHHTTPEEIARLMAASNVVSADAIPAEKDQDGKISGSFLDHHADEVERQPDNQYESQEAFDALGFAITLLNPIERKLLKMKGVRT